MNKEVKAIVAALLTASLVMATAAQAAGDKEAGKEKAIPCQICHGKGGRSTNPLYPVLAGQTMPLSEANHLRFGVSSTPTLVLVDRAGIIRLYHPGRVPLEQLEPRIRALLAAS